jgi:hypothetical protein
MAGLSLVGPRAASLSATYQAFGIRMSLKVNIVFFYGSGSLTDSQQQNAPQLRFPLCYLVSGVHLSSK